MLLSRLLILEHHPGYGYGFLERLGDAGVEVDANTLYPMLRRLEKQGLLTSEWDTRVETTEVLSHQRVSASWLWLSGTSSTGSARPGRG